MAEKCVVCGRPADEDYIECPTCKRRWVDEGICGERWTEIAEEVVTLGRKTARELKDKGPLEGRIPANDAHLLLEKLFSEAVPVVAYFTRDGIKVMKHGRIIAVTTQDGLVVSESDDEPSLSYLAVSLGNPLTNGCTFHYGERGDFPTDTMTALKANTELSIKCPDGGRLRLFFSI